FAVPQLEQYFSVRIGLPQFGHGMLCSSVKLSQNSSAKRIISAIEYPEATDKTSNPVHTENNCVRIVCYLIFNSWEHSTRYEKHRRWGRDSNPYKSAHCIDRIC